MQGLNFTQFSIFRLVWEFRNVFYYYFVLYRIQSNVESEGGKIRQMSEFGEKNLSKIQLRRKYPDERT